MAHVANVDFVACSSAFSNTVIVVGANRTLYEVTSPTEAQELVKLDWQPLAEAGHGAYLLSTTVRVRTYAGCGLAQNPANTKPRCGRIGVRGFCRAVSSGSEQPVCLPWRCCWAWAPTTSVSCERVFLTSWLYRAGHAQSTHILEFLLILDSSSNRRVTVPMTNQTPILAKRAVHGVPTEIGLTLLDPPRCAKMHIFRNALRGEIQSRGA